MEIVVTTALLAIGVGVALWPAWFRAETRAKRRRYPGYSPPHLMGVFDEVFHPAAYNAMQIVEAETRAAAPAPLPGDPAHIPGAPVASGSHRRRIALPRPSEQRFAADDGWPSVGSPEGRRG